LLKKFAVFGLLWASACSTGGIKVAPCLHGPAGYGADCSTERGEVKLDEAALEGYECYSPEDGRAIREWIKRRFHPAK
jgi:hypothetical protein